MSLVKSQTINLVKNVIVGGRVDDLYRFVVQPEFCTHLTCGFQGGKKDTDGRLIKPKCTYVSYRKLTEEEIAHPDMKSLFIGMWVNYLDNDGDQRYDRVLFDMNNDCFCEISFQEGGNDRLVVDTRIQRNPKEVLAAMSNYTEYVETVKGLL